MAKIKHEDLMKAHAVNSIYVSVLSKGYTISHINEVRPNIYMVVMKNGMTSRSVLLVPII